jgi:hypothetical protein
MPLAPQTRVTTRILWEGALIFGLIDILLVLALRLKVESGVFRNLKWRLVATTGLFWLLLLAFLMSGFFWEPVYHYVFPDWARWYIPPAYGLLFAALGLLFWWLALRLPGHPVITWCLLGGAWGMVTHIWAIYRGILDKPPMLQGASPVATAIMPIFEFIFYYGLILSLALVGRRIRRIGLSEL